MTEHTRDEAAAYKAAMEQDGWASKPLSGPGDEYYELRKGRWVAHINLRNHVLYDRVRVWGPDRLQIVVPPKYSWEALQQHLRVCQYCGAEAVKTYRMSFAGRCCYACRHDPKVIAREEFAGWTD